MIQNTTRRCMFTEKGLKEKVLASSFQGGKHLWMNLAMSFMENTSILAETGTRKTMLDTIAVVVETMPTWIFIISPRQCFLMRR